MTNVTIEINQARAVERRRRRRGDRDELRGARRPRRPDRPEPRQRHARLHRQRLQRLRLAHASRSASFVYALRRRRVREGRDAQRCAARGRRRPATVTALKIGASNVNVFVGINGPYDERHGLRARSASSLTQRLVRPRAAEADGGRLDAQLLRADGVGERDRARRRHRRDAPGDDIDRRDQRLERLGRGRRHDRPGVDFSRSRRLHGPDRARARRCRSTSHDAAAPRERASSRSGSPASRSPRTSSSSRRRAAASRRSRSLSATSPSRSATFTIQDGPHATSHTNGLLLHHEPGRRRPRHDPGPRASPSATARTASASPPTLRSRSTRRPRRSTRPSRSPAAAPTRSTSRAARTSA